MNQAQTNSSLLEQILEQPTEQPEVLLPFGSPTETFYIEREIDLQFNFLENKTRCGSENNSNVKLRVRAASNVRDSQGFVFDNAILTKIQKSLNGANMSVSCEDLAIFTATAIRDQSRTPLKWISVAVESDFPGQITFNWKDKEEMPSVRLMKIICETEAQTITRNGGTAYKIERNEAAPLFRGCGH